MNLKDWKKQMNTLSILSYLFLGFSQLIIAQEKSLQYSINHKEIEGLDSSGNYSFFVSGHFHGSSNNTTGLPAITLTSNIDNINADSANFLVCLGDLFLDVKNDIPLYKKHLINKLRMPLFNVPGNHDKYENIYEENFGTTFFYFNFHNDLFIFLDTELNDGSISDEQLMMLKSALSYKSKINNIFVFTHRLIWAEDHAEMKHLFKGNTRSKNGNNFKSKVFPLIKKYANGSNVYFMGGSLGDSPAPFFYHNEGNVFFIATAIRDTPKDAFLKVNIVEGKVKFSAFPLLMPIEFYNLDFYNGKYKKAPGFNWRLVPLYIKNMIFHRYFWYGLAFAFLPLIIFLFAKKYSNKKRKIND
jgi:hypothetical protein